MLDMQETPSTGTPTGRQCATYLRHLLVVSRSPLVCRLISSYAAAIGAECVCVADIDDWRLGGPDRYVDGVVIDDAVQDNASLSRIVRATAPEAARRFPKCLILSDWRPDTESVPSPGGCRVEVIIKPILLQQFRRWAMRRTAGA